MVKKYFLINVSIIIIEACVSHDKICVFLFEKEGICHESWNYSSRRQIHSLAFYIRKKYKIPVLVLLFKKK